MGIAKRRLTLGRPRHVERSHETIPTYTTRGAPLLLKRKDGVIRVESPQRVLLAQTCLAGQDFGFTQVDVDLLTRHAHAMLDDGARGPLLWLAARIGALLVHESPLTADGPMSDAEVTALHAAGMPISGEPEFLKRGFTKPE